MKFINRKEELVRLNHLVKRKESNVVVLWGRRRVGKSRLLMEWKHRHDGIYYIADESAATIQRKYFSMVLEQALPGFSEVEYPDWTAFFMRLARDALQKKWRGPLVIDELPYLIAISPELPSILQKFIDYDAKKAKLIIVLCGSSQQMMQGAVLDSSAPLYGRADEIIKLKPISIGYMGEALKLKTTRAIIEAYSVWGGIPRYWELVQKNKGSFLETIDRLVLDPMGPLHDEPNHLLLEESATHLRPILDAIGLGAHRLSEIAAKIGQPVTSLMRYVQGLIELEFIGREHPYGVDEKNSKRTLYKIKDPFLRFWFTCVASKRSFLSQTSPSLRLEWLKQVLPKLFSVTWEELCRFAIPFLTKKLGNTPFKQASRFWQGQEFEWDILASSEDGKTLLIGEAKWTSKAPSASFIQAAIQELKNKGLPPTSRHLHGKVLYVLFVPEKPPSLALSSDVRLICAQEVISALN